MRTYVCRRHCIASLLFLWGISMFVACGDNGDAKNAGGNGGSQNAGNGDSQNADRSLTNTSWALESYGPSGDETSLVPGTKISLYFEENGSISGWTGCNPYEGDYEPGDDSYALDMTPTSRDLLHCNDPAGVGDQETAYLRALRYVTSFAIGTETLVLTYNDGQSQLNYRETREAQNAAWVLRKTGWVLESYGPSGNETSLVPRTKISLYFEEDGSISGWTGCSTYWADYEVGDDDSLSITQNVSGQEFCDGPADVVDQEAAYIQALGDVSSVVVGTGTLVLTYNAGQDQLNYRETGDASKVDWVLRDTRWILESFESSGNKTSPIPGTEIRLRFTENGGISGSMGCNDYWAAAYRLGKNNSLSMTSIARSAMYCGDPTGVMEEEVAYLDDALRYVASFAMGTETLVLSYNAGQDQLNYREITD